MKTRFILSFIAFALMVSTFGQKPALELTFTAIDNASYVQLDNIKVMNRTRGGDTILYYPDTVLVLDYQVGITEVTHEKTGLQVFQNYPNPIEDQTTITLYVPEKDKVDLMITDILGRLVIRTDYVLDKGYHSFRFTPGIGSLFFFTALWKGHSSSIKVLHSASDSHLAGSLEYIGSDYASQHLKTTESVQNFSFTPGDELLYIGYANGLLSSMLDAPEASKTITFQFATNIPCPGTPLVTYGGQVYNTIQIYSQCWLKESLNVGTMIPGNQGMTDNGILEKYCYNNEPAKCAFYGGLYQWEEMMQYSTTEGVQGICPSGWHIPTDEDWKVLEGAVDSQYGTGDPEWEIGESFRGLDAGTNLKSTSGWSYNGNGTDLFGFSGLPNGLRVNGGIFNSRGLDGHWWTSSGGTGRLVWYRYLYFDSPGVYRSKFYCNKGYGFSVRCLKDN